MLTEEEREGIEALRKSAPNNVRPVIIHQWIAIIDRLSARVEELEEALEDISTCGSIGVAEVTARQALKGAKED